MFLEGGFMRTQATTHAGDLYWEQVRTNPGYQAYQILHWGFVIAPILAGLDKFFMKLTDWTMYLWAPIGNLFGTPRTFMDIVAAIEIIEKVSVNDNVIFLRFAALKSQARRS